MRRYTNGDILFCDELVTTLQTILDGIKRGDVHKKVMIVGQRYNSDVGDLAEDSPYIIRDPASAKAVVDALRPRSEKFQVRCAGVTPTRARAHARTHTHRPPPGVPSRTGCGMPV